MAMIVVSYLFPVVYCTWHFGDIQDKYLPQNIVIAITDFWHFDVRYCFWEQEHCCFYFFFTIFQIN